MTGRWLSSLRGRDEPPEEPRELATAATHVFDLNDPFVAFLVATDSPVDIAAAPFDTQLVHELRDAGVDLVVPIVTGGELVGMLTLGPRRTGQAYNDEDRRLLQRLSGRAAPALRLAEVIRVQADEMRERERISQELRVARLIQQNFLPTQLPEVPGWRIGTFYQPAREVGGDFYDFVPLSDGRLALMIGDVTDKGVPAALVMATTRSLLREAAQQTGEPAHVLERVNRALIGDIPKNMFVTCQYATLDPTSGKLTMSNAGHSLPYLSSPSGVSEMRATGFPLGLMEGTEYDQVVFDIGPGSRVLFHSDGLTEARNSQGDMFGAPRLMGLVGKYPRDRELVEYLISELQAFSGAAAETEDDVTLVSLERTLDGEGQIVDARTRILTDFTVSSQLGNDREVIRQVVAAVEDLDLSQRQIDKLQTAVGEAAINAIEHGNRFRADQPVEVRALSSASAVTVEVTDLGGEGDLEVATDPNLEAKLAGDQSPRGWGLFLMKNLVDDVSIETRGRRRTVRLVIQRGDTT